MAEFKVFGDAVRKRFAEMSQEPLFEVKSERDTIWDTYLGSYPEGSNPKFRERTEHDCSCCRHFIYTTGNVVAIQNGVLSSIWDLNGLPEPYQTVADAMSRYVKSLPIRDVFYSAFKQHGQLISRAMIEWEPGVKSIHTFDHFSADIPTKCVTSVVAEKQGKARTTHDVLMRWLAELKPDAIALVVDLIKQNAVYRGNEVKRQVLAYQALQADFLAKEPKDRDLFVWAKVHLDGAITHLHSTAIGALIRDLSDGMSTDAALTRYETATDARNYKRPTSIITPQEVNAALKTIQELGLEPALERRHARFSDVSVNSVLFVDNSVRSLMKGGLSDLLMSATKPQSFDASAATEIGIDDFVKSVLPKTTQIKLLLDNGLLGKFVSLTAPVHEDAPPIFKWPNNFGWSYEGNVTDSIKARVKKAGGLVDNVALRVSLAWYNLDDLDLHCVEPNGHHIYYGWKEDKSGKRILDVDMNAGGGFGRAGHTREPVENMRWITAPGDGVYQFYVNNYAKTENADVGFEIEIEGGGLSGIETLRYEKAVLDKHNVPVADIVIQGGRIAEVRAAAGMVKGSASKEQWGLKTLDFAKVNSLVLSPNYWGESEVGNKHWMFILDGCRNPLPVRCIYNEHLRDDLLVHRRAFEVLGEKTKAPVAQEQLSGVGFSVKPNRERVTVTANGRSYSITF